MGERTWAMVVLSAALWPNRKLQSQTTCGAPDAARRSSSYESVVFLTGTTFEKGMFLRIAMYKVDSLFFVHCYRHPSLHAFQQSNSVYTPH